MKGLSLAEFDALFDRFASSDTSTVVFRWGAQQQYHLAHDEPSWRAAQEGTPWPDRSVRTDPWLARMARTTLAGKRWERVQRVEEPHSPYIVWLLVAFMESATCGEQIAITHDMEVTLPDFWLFDGTDVRDRYAVLMHYTDSGELEHIEYRDDTDQLDILRDAAEALRRAPTERLNAYLVRVGTAGVV